MNTVHNLHRFLNLQELWSNYKAFISLFLPHRPLYLPLSQRCPSLPLPPPPRPLPNALLPHPRASPLSPFSILTGAWSRLMEPPSCCPAPLAPACWPAAARVTGGSCPRGPLRLLPLSRPRSAPSSSLRQLPGSARPHDAATSRLHPDASAWPWSPAPPWALHRLHLAAVALARVPPYSGSAGVASGRRHRFGRFLLPNSFSLFKKFNSDFGVDCFTDFVDICQRSFMHADEWRWVTAGGGAASPEVATALPPLSTPCSAMWMILL